MANQFVIPVDFHINTRGGDVDIPAGSTIYTDDDNDYVRFEAPKTDVPFITAATTPTIEHPDSTVPADVPTVGPLPSFGPFISPLPEEPPASLAGPMETEAAPVEPAAEPVAPSDPTPVPPPAAPAPIAEPQPDEF